MVNNVSCGRPASIFRVEVRGFSAPTTLQSEVSAMKAARYASRSYLLQLLPSWVETGLFSFTSRSKSPSASQVYWRVTSSGLKYHKILRQPNVSEEYIASIFTVEEQACRLLLLVFCLAYFSTVNLLAICSYETSGSLRTTRYTT
jgi:hypothetical protein